MVYTVDKKLPESFFVQILTEKVHVLKKHLKDTICSLVMCANIRPNVATFKLYNTNEEDSLKLRYTISNLGDLGDQLYQLWVQLNYLLWEHYPYQA